MLAELKRDILTPSPERLNRLLSEVAATGDRAAFTELFEHFAPRVKGFLMKGGASAEEAEDLAQDVMIKMLRRARQFDPARASVATWIFTIARNARIDALRRRAKARFDQDDPSLQPEEEPRADFLCELADRDQRIAEALRRLPAEQREVMRLHFYADESHAAIAEQLGVPLGTVKSRLRLAFEKVRQDLEEQAP